MKRSNPMGYDQGMRLLEQLRAAGHDASWHAVGGAGLVVVTWH